MRRKILSRFTIVTLLILSFPCQQATAGPFRVLFADPAGDILAGPTTRYGRSGNVIKRSNYDGSDVRVVATPVLLLGSAYSTDEVLYLDWNVNDSQIYYGRANLLNGSQAETAILPFTDFNDRPFGLISTTLNRILWNDSGRLLISNLDGTALTPIYSEGNDGAYCADFYVDQSSETRVILGDGTALEFITMELDGSDQQTVGRTSNSFSSGCPAISPDRTQIFWTDRFGEEIRRAGLTGQPQVTLIENLTDARTLVIDSVNEKLIWADFGTILRANLDGSGVEDVVVGLPDAPIITLLDEDDGKLYWFLDGVAERSNLDGSNRERLFDVLFADSFE